jgi:uncharacterized protein YqeY
MLQKLQDEMKLALREKKTERLNVIRMLITQVKNEAYIKGIQRSADEVVLAYQKKLEKAKNECSGNLDFIAKLDSEIAVVAEFAPRQMTEEDIVAFLADKFSGTTPDMKSAMKELKGKADGKLVSKVISSWNDEKKS